MYIVLSVCTSTNYAKQENQHSTAPRKANCHWFVMVHTERSFSQI